MCIAHERVGGRVTRACVLAQAVGKAIALRSRFRQTLVAITLQASVRRTCRRTQWCAAMHECRVLLQRAAARLGYVKKCGATHQLMVLLQRAAARVATSSNRLSLSLSLSRSLARRACSLSLRACIHACFPLSHGLVLAHRALIQAHGSVAESLNRAFIEP